MKVLIMRMLPLKWLKYLSSETYLIVYKVASCYFLCEIHAQYCDVSIGDSCLAIRKLWFSNPPPEI